MNDLEDKCDELEHYSRRNVIRIRGIPEKVGEYTDIVVRELAEKKLDAKIVAHDNMISSRAFTQGRADLGRHGDTARCHSLVHQPQYIELHHAKRSDTQGFSYLRKRSHDEDPREERL